jgi:hypothetical protein
MCDFFSFISKGDGKFKYFTAKERRSKKVLNKYCVDSHTSIAEAKFKLNHAEDSCNKFEYVGGFVRVDQINAKRDDTAAAKRFMKNLIKSGKWRAICLAEMKKGNYGRFCKTLKTVPKGLINQMIRKGYVCYLPAHIQLKIRW